MQFAEHLDLFRSQSVEDVARIVVALAYDPDLTSLVGNVAGVGQLAARYCIDITG